MNTAQDVIAYGCAAPRKHAVFANAASPRHKSDISKLFDLIDRMLGTKAKQAMGLTGPLIVVDFKLLKKCSSWKRM